MQILRGLSSVRRSVADKVFKFEMQIAAIMTHHSYFCLSGVCLGFCQVRFLFFFNTTSGFHNLWLPEGTQSLVITCRLTKESCPRRRASMCLRIVGGAPKSSKAPILSPRHHSRRRPPSQAPRQRQGQCQKSRHTSSSAIIRSISPADRIAPGLPPPTAT